jgi:hypothetical protein
VKCSAARYRPTFGPPLKERINKQTGEEHTRKRARTVSYQQSQATQQYPSLTQARKSFVLRRDNNLRSFLDAGRAVPTQTESAFPRVVVVHMLTNGTGGPTTTHHMFFGFWRPCATHTYVVRFLSRVFLRKLTSREESVVTQPHHGLLSGIAASGIFCLSNPGLMRLTGKQHTGSHPIHLSRILSCNPHHLSRVPLLL